MQTLGALDVDGLNVGVQTLLGTLLVVTLAGDADAETEGNTLDTSLPDLLVQGGVDTDILGALYTEKNGVSKSDSDSTGGGSALPWPARRKRGSP